MEIIIKSYLQEFSENFGLIAKYNENDRFEFFSIYCTLFNEYSLTNFNLHDVLTGKATPGIDGIAIIVNNKICTSVREIEDLLEMNKYLDVSFIFIQAKVSKKFSGTEISNFFDCVTEFFRDENNLFSSNNMKNFLEMKDYIYRNSRYMRNRSPICKLYYVSTGEWNYDNSLNGKVKQRIKQLSTLNIFEKEKVMFIPCGSEELIKLYRKTNEQPEVTINFEKKTILSNIPDVKVAYYGLLPFSEFKKIIIDENDNIKPVFDDNIRDYLETLKNPVNTDIHNILKSDKNIYFTLMNNGITVVCEDIIGPSEIITLKNYQIVNGCQTSHVLFQNRHLNIENLDIPIKIISTDNPQIKSDITRATNNQTAVSIEELEALNVFQRKLEDYFIAMGNKIYYERRTNQFRNSSIEKNRIISIEMQVKIFSSMILDIPHTVSGNYGKLLKELKTNIFNIEHNLKVYYVSSLSYSKLLDLFDELYIDENLWKFRFHILMIFKYISMPRRTPNIKAKKEIENYCDKLLEILESKQMLKSKIKDSIDVLRLNELNIDFNDRKSSELKSNTEKILEYLKMNFTQFKNKKIDLEKHFKPTDEEKILVQKSLFEL